MSEVKKYIASMGKDNKYAVFGPGTGMDYWSGTLFPEYRLSSAPDAQAAALIANAAYKAGYEDAQAEFRRVLGLDR